MPHSSGGGSSHGGSHGGSHSSGSSHSSGGSRGSSQRVSHTHFNGARTYVRYVNHKPEYIYSNYDVKKGAPTFVYIFMAVIYLAFFVPLTGLIFNSFGNPKRLSGAGVQKNYPEIYDEADVLGDTSRLEDVLYHFYDKTGIVPVVYTMYNEEWQGRYSSLEQFAYNLYVYNYSDEKHWLLLYTLPEQPDPNDRFGDWYWEGMQGDDTDSILTEQIADQFNRKLHDSLVAGNTFSTTEAFINAFNYIDGDLMKFRVDGGQLAGAGFGLVFVIVHAAVMFGASIGSSRKYKDYVEVKQEGNSAPLEDTCMYCDGVYVVGTVTACPHCGAALPAHNPYYDSYRS